MKLRHKAAAPTKYIAFFALTLIVAGTFANQAGAREVCGSVIKSGDVAGCQFLKEAGLTSDTKLYDSLQSQRILKPLLALADDLAPAVEAARNDPQNLDTVLRGVVDHMIKEDSLGYIFVLQGLSHLYYDSKDPRMPLGLMTEGRRIAKRFRHRLDHVQDYTRFLKTAAAIQAVEQNQLASSAQTPGFLSFSPSIISDLEAAREARLQILLKYIKGGVDGSWLVPAGTTAPSPFQVYLKIAAAAGKFDFETDRYIVLKSIDHTLKEFSKRRFDFTELEGKSGVHDLRRQLRWFSIYARATDGLILSDNVVGISPKSPAAFFDNIEKDSPEYAKQFRKYGELPANTGVAAADVCHFSRPLYLAYTKYIGEIGNIKSVGEDSNLWALSLASDSLAKNPGFLEKMKSPNMDFSAPADARKFAFDLLENYMYSLNPPLLDEGGAATPIDLALLQKDPEFLTMVKTSLEDAEHSARELARRMDFVHGLKFYELSATDEVYSEITSNGLIEATRQEIENCFKK